MPESGAVQWAALGALASGLLLKLLDYLLGGSGRRLSGRKDVREEIAQLWKRIDELGKEIEGWQDRYQRLQDSYQQLSLRYQETLLELTSVKAELVAIKRAEMGRMRPSSDKPGGNPADVS